MLKPPLADRVVLDCAACGRALTTGVKLVSETVVASDGQDGTPTIAAGSLAQLAAACRVPVTQNGVTIRMHEYSAAGAYLGNPADLVRGHVVSTGKNDNGCCGSDGCDGPNRKCVCGAVVGTEWSDCWTRAEFRLAPDAVALKPLTS